MYLFIRSSTNPGPRVSRIIKYFASNKKNIIYLSPLRSGDDVNESFRDMGNLGTYDYFDGQGILKYMIFLLKTNYIISKKIIFNRKKIRFIHFSDLEVILAGAILCKIFGISFVYNIHDNFFQRYDFNRVLSSFLKYLETFFILISDKVFVPESFRSDAYPKFVTKKIKVIKNFPDFDIRSNHIPFTEDYISMFYGGWISPNRSLNHYFDLADGLIRKGFLVKLNICGWGDKGYIEKLKDISQRKGIKFNYFGQISQSDVIDHLKSADLSIAYYNPNKVINIFAASNKIPEIIGSNTILVTNKHTKIAEKIRPYKISLQFDESPLEILGDLADLINNKDQVIDFTERARSFYLKEYNSEKLKSEISRNLHEYV